MPITVAELQTELTIDASHLDRGLESGTKKINTWASQDFKEARLDVNVAAAKAAIALLRADFNAFRRETAQGITVSIFAQAHQGTLAPTLGAPALPAPRASTAAPARIAATTAATIEQITRVSETRAGVAAQRVTQISAEAAAKAQATTTQGAARAETIRVQSEVRTQERIERIREEFAVRQQLKEEARASKPQPTYAQSLAKTADKMQDSGQEDVQDGAILTAAITVPIAGITGLVVNSGIKWESVFTDVRKTVDGTAQDFARLEKQLRAMAAGDNAIPIDVEELAKIAASAGQLGIETPAIAKFTRTVADLGQTTNMTSDQAADSFARFANIIQMPQTQFDRLGSTVVALGNKTAATEGEIMEMALRLAGAGHQVDLSASQIMGFAAALASVGIEAESGGTAFSRVFVQMEQAVRNGGKELEIYAKTAGVSTAKFKKSFDQDASQAVLSFIGGLNRMKQAGGNVFGTLDALQLSEVRVRDALLRAAGAGDLFSTALKTGDSAWRSNTALTKEAETRYGTTASQIKILTNRLKEQGLEISARLLPVVNRLLSTYGNAVPLAIRSTTEAFDALPVGMQQSAIALVALVALAGPAQMMAGNVKLLAGAFTGLWAAAAANPAVAIAAVIGLAGGYLLLSKTFDRISQAQEKVKVTAGELSAGLGRMLDVLPEGSKHAVAIKKIRDEIAAAGTDVAKLDQAARDLDRVKAQIDVDVKNPDLRLVMSDEVTKAQALLDRQKLTVEVVVQSVYKNALDTIGMTNPGRPIHEISNGEGGKSWTNNLIDWSQGWGWDGQGEGDRGLDTGTDYEAALARRRGHVATMQKKAAALAAQQKKDATAAWANLTKSGNGLLSPLPLRDLLTGQTLGDAANPNPFAPASAPTSAAVEAARARLLASKPKPKPAPVTPADKPGTFGGVEASAEKASKAQEKADQERERQARAAEAALERWRTKQAQLAEESARPWEKLDDTVSVLSARLGEFDKKTDSARLRAQMLRSEFDGIPEPIKQATIAMAQLLDKTEELGRQRDAMRDANVSTLGNLMRSGADMKSVLAAIGAQEKTYDFGGRIDANRAKAGRIAGAVGPLAEAEAQSRNAAASRLRLQNDESRFGAAGIVKGNVGAGTIVSMVKEVHENLPKFKQTCAWAVSQVYEKLGVELNTQNNNWAANLVKYAKANWRQVDAASAPPGALLAEPSASANSGYHVTLSRGGRARAGSNNRAPQFKTAGKNALAFVPPELESRPSAESSPTVALSNKTPIIGARKAAPLVGADGKLLPFTAKQLEDLLSAWGPMLTDAGARPGESRDFRLAGQDKLLSRLAAGEKISPAQAKADREVANRADYAKARTDATNGATLASKAFNRVEEEKIRVLAEARAALDASGGSLAAYERAAFMAQKRIEIWSSTEVQALWNQKRVREANALAAGMLAKAGAGYDAGKGNETHQADVARTQQQARATELLSAQRDYLAQNAGKPETAIASGLDLLARRNAVYNELRQNHNAAESKRLADQWARGEKLNDSLRDRIELEQQLAAQKRETDDHFAGLADESRALGTGLNRGEREREQAANEAERAKARELAGAVAKGTMSQHEADGHIRTAGEDAFAAYDREAANRKTGAGRDAGEDHAARMASLDSRRRKTIGLDASSPELQIQLQLLERRNDLEAQNKQVIAAERIDVDARLGQYEEEIRAESALSRLTQSRQNLSTSLEFTLQLQKEHELSMAHTAKERLAVEQKYQNLLNERRGIEVSPEEKAEQQGQQAQTEENEQADKGRAAAERMRDLMASSIEEGGKKGVAGAMKHWVEGIAEMGRKAAFTRISTLLTNRLFGSDLPVDEDGSLGGMGRGRKSQGDSGTQREAQSDGGAPSFASAVRRTPLPLSPDIDLAPFPPIKKRGVLDSILGGKKGELSSATIYITNATEHIDRATQHVKTATIHTANSTSAGGSGGAGSSPSDEQKLSAAMDFFARTS
jgi:TP901 family phage tail tape measure protein